LVQLAEIAEFKDFLSQFGKEHKHCQNPPCGKPFLPPSSFPKEIYCSKACADEHYIKRYGTSSGLQTTQPVGVPRTLPGVTQSGTIEAQ
jgi:hypothetical protein